MKRFFDFIISKLPYLFVFLASLYAPLDADLGWHLKYGEYFYQHLTPLRNNLYSASMQNFHWINSSWVTDIISYTLFHLMGFLGLSIAAAFVVMLTFFFISSAFKLTFLKQAIFFPIILFLELPINNVSFRGQQLSLLFLAILLFLLNSYGKIIFSEKIKRAYLIPILFLTWANVHGEYLLGLGVLGVWIVGKLISDFLTTERKKSVFISKKKGNVVYESPYRKVHVLKTLRQIRFWAIIFFLSVIVTFINPFGFLIYKEAFTHVGNADLKYIAEYIPFKDLSSDWRNIFLVGSLLLFGGIILFLSGKLIKKLPNVLVVFVLFALTLWIRRFAWAFYYSTPAIFSAFVGFDEKNGKWIKLLGSGILLLATLLVFFYNNPLDSFSANWSTYCDSYIACSPKSANFLTKTKIKTPLWTNYNWGGWLIWNYPNVKPLIDGRMHLWREKNGYSAFDEYYPLEQNQKDINESRFNTAYAWKGKPIADRLLELIQEKKWKLLYVDDKAIIAERIMPSTSIIPSE